MLSLTTESWKPSNEGSTIKNKILEFEVTGSGIFETTVADLNVNFMFVQP